MKSAIRSAMTVTRTAIEMTGVGVLVVDDDAVLRSTLKRELQRRGFTVWSARDGVEAVSLYEEYREQIAVVLCDLRMPVMDGIETQAALLRVNPSLPICLMTGNPTEIPASIRLPVILKPFVSIQTVAKTLRETITDRTGAR